jgi:hypothetical protein
MVINNSRKGKSDQYRTLIKKPQLGTELDFNDYHTQNICGSAKSLAGFESNAERYEFV